jgi:hypothetical protein
MDRLDLLTASRQLLTILAVRHKTSVPPVVFYDSCESILCIVYYSTYFTDHRYIAIHPHTAEDPNVLLMSLLHEFAHHRDIEYGLPCDCRYPCNPEACEERASKMEEEWGSYLDLWESLLG